ncbi:hypothetical protein DPMN_152875 [Dreissena polymorpha]|uniref:Uncharacterized protein n=1 Tax=Dreissena polymorpha TaxID=45954 RepID=A0A9D4FHK8_DREPO|nr:hypothetical protein DPMN_152875 [Dreissena polymorpha]
MQQIQQPKSQSARGQSDTDSYCQESEYDDIENLRKNRSQSSSNFNEWRENEKATGGVF